MAVDDKIQCLIRVETKRFYNPDNNFGIIKAHIKSCEKGIPVVDTYGNAIFLGEMPEPKAGCIYEVLAREVCDPKWGTQYRIINMCTKMVINMEDASAKREFLATLYTEGQVQSMYEALEDPYKTLSEGDAKSLITVKGCGIKTAMKWLDKFKKNINLSRIFVELKDYEITSALAKKILEHYKSPDIVIDNIKRNPYVLMEISGIGWKKCDELAIKSGLGKYSPFRIEAFIKYYLNAKAQEGYTFVYTNSQLMNAIVEEFGEEIPDQPIVNAIRHMGNKLWWDENQEKIGLSYYVNLEEKIAKELIRIRDGENNFKYDNWKEIVKQKEKEQGWEFTDQQWEGIQAVLENQVVIITGLGGTGKSSVVSGMIEVLRDYSFAQCALAGRAAARLSEITKAEGYTIHRLLGYNPMMEGEEGYKDGFAFHDENPLPYNIIILDEISMVNGQLFYQLLRAIPTGSKLIMLGDVGQLESIGCSNIAYDLIQSPEIKSVELTKIHRQAASSAIIIESIKARNGVQVIEKDWVGVETRGELQDLTYNCFSDKGNTFYKVMQYVSTLLEREKNILNIQVITPIKEKDSGTWSLNEAIQELYNPSNSKTPELFVHYDGNHGGFLRVGDKVINTVNNYDAVSYVGQWENQKEVIDEETGKVSVIAPSGESTPIYNGNIGIITQINEELKEIVVDFIGIGEVLIEKDRLSSILLGYAITCHKLQGSECNYVIFGMDFGSYILLSRELVYTAITRAKKHCYVIAQNNALRYAIGRTNIVLKQTLLKEFLYKETHPKLVF